MKSISIGKLRGLQQISSARGTITALALDHRQNLRKANPAFVSDEALARFKLDVTAALAMKATAVLLDPEYSAAQVSAARVMPGGVGLVVAVESTGYTGPATARLSQLLPSWGVDKVKRMGASAAKLLVYYHPNSAAAKDIESLVERVAEDCAREDLLLMLEPLSYSIYEDRRLTSEEKQHVIVETARRLTPLGVDVLKAEFPLDISERDESEWRQACKEISSASSVPWILLSAAADYDTYLRQVTTACNAGASGIAAGRALWQEAVSKMGTERNEVLTQVAGPRLARLASLCHALARPWTDFFSADPSLDWYKNY
jgi:tagatose-1,6-bisphosphate aldolase